MAQSKGRHAKTKTVMMAGSMEAVKSFKADRAASLGCDDYVAKTGDYAALTEAVSNLLNLQ